MSKRFLWIYLGGMLVLAVSAWAADARLSGKWLLTHDPDGPVKEDWMLFRERGDVDLGNAKGVYITCPYKVEKDFVTLTCNVRGQTKQLIMSVRDDYRELLNRSGAVYTRQ